MGEGRVSYASQAEQMDQIEEGCDGGRPVLRKDGTATGKYARVLKIHEGNVGKVMFADVEHNNPNEDRCRMTTHPIHKLIMVDLVKEKKTWGKRGRVRKGTGN